jgi:hypothetical protein
MEDEQKVSELRELISAIVDNTKNESQGRNGSPTREKRAASKVLGRMLGRRPRSAEIRLALTV